MKGSNHTPEMSPSHPLKTKCYEAFTPHDQRPPQRRGAYQERMEGILRGFPNGSSFGMCN